MRLALQLAPKLALHVARRHRGTAASVVAQRPMPLRGGLHKLQVQPLGSLVLPYGTCLLPCEHIVDGGRPTDAGGSSAVMRAATGCAWLIIRITAMGPRVSVADLGRMQVRLLHGAATVPRCALALAGCVRTRWGRGG